MNKDKLVTVFHNNIEVGTLGWSEDRKIIFQYSPQWIFDGFSLSPFFLPLERDVFIFDNCEHIEGICGCFYDSLPDQWSYILLKKYLKKKGIDYDSLDTLEKLCYSSSDAIGSLNYLPCKNNNFLKISSYELDGIFDKTRKILDGEEVDSFDEIFSLGSSSGGSRPKINVIIDKDKYIVKFPNNHDLVNMGQMEYDYMSCAKECGIVVPEIKLLPSKVCSGYFAIKRFDIKPDNSKKYVISASSILNKNAFDSVFSYNNLFKLTSILTNSSLQDIEQLFRVMVFNYLADNQDDHAKNFSFIFDENNKRWSLSPAYDLTNSHTRFGEHQILVAGKGKDVTKEDLINEASGFGIDKDTLSSIYEEISKIINFRLNKYLLK